MLVRARAAAAATTSLPGMHRLWRGGGSGAAACFPLRRALLDVRGAETAVFLQGLLTNDVTQLVAGDGPPAAPALPRALYAHALNVQGRCLYDLILYRLHESPEEEPHVLLECDSGVLDAIQKHLKLYKIRRKVNIAPCLDLSLWAVIPGEQAGDIASSLAKCADLAPVLSPDPRTEVMGWRVITKKGVNLSEIIPGSHVGNIQDYHRHRYKQGVPEGVKDLPPGVALPLESNLAYMNGISFTKGCYIGQELTARTHHVGVIRKRLLPVQFPAPLPTDSIPEGADIVTETGKSAGKFRFGGGELGIALLRLANVNEALYLNSGGDKVKLTASIPEWWPKTASK
ncbi:putative transferase CAF17, mitochondrial isoform X1 [Lathamus discolor]|uniref:putative transferase CAF17, mitochondrial isoform X1 n=2 Tax=Lathamus discolor TaxID=678569 RepID=UPI0032B7941F